MIVQLQFPSFVLAQNPTKKDNGKLAFTALAQAHTAEHEGSLALFFDRNEADRFAERFVADATVVSCADENGLFDVLKEAVVLGFDHVGIVTDAESVYSYPIGTIMDKLRAITGRWD